MNPKLKAARLKELRQKKADTLNSEKPSNFLAPPSSKAPTPQASKPTDAASNKEAGNKASGGTVSRRNVVLLSGGSSRSRTPASSKDAGHHKDGTRRVSSDYHVVMPSSNKRSSTTPSDQLVKKSRFTAGAEPVGDDNPATLVEDFESIYEHPLAKFERRYPGVKAEQGFVDSIDDLDFSKLNLDEDEAPPLIADPFRIHSPPRKKLRPDDNFIVGLDRYINLQLPTLKAELAEDEAADEDFTEVLGNQKLTAEAKRTMFRDVFNCIPKTYQDSLKGAQEGHIGAVMSIMLECLVRMNGVRKRARSERRETRLNREKARSAGEYLDQQACAIEAKNNETLSVLAKRIAECNRSYRLALIRVAKLQDENSNLKQQQTESADQENERVEAEVARKVKVALAEKMKEKEEQMARELKKRDKMASKITEELTAAKEKIVELENQMEEVEQKAYSEGADNLKSLVAKAWDRTGLNMPAEFILERLTRLEMEDCAAETGEPLPPEVYHYHLDHPEEQRFATGADVGDASLEVHGD